MNSNDNLYIKVHTAIKNAKVEKYMSDKEKIAEEGVSFWGGITGKNNLQIERLKNVKLKLELLQTEKVNDDTSTYKSEDLMADLYACAISELGGKFNEEMESVYNEVKNEYKNNENSENFDISDGYIYELACRKIDKGQSYLPIIHQERPRGIFGDIKVQTAFLKLENQKLVNEIIASRGKSRFDTFKNEDKKESIIVPTDWKNRKKA